MWTIDKKGTEATMTVNADRKTDLRAAMEEFLEKDNIEVRHLRLIVSRPLDISGLLKYYQLHELQHGDDHGVRYYKTVESVTVLGQRKRDALPLHPKWVTDIRDQCKKAEVEFRFRHWGEWIPKTEIADFVSWEEPFGWRVRDEWLPVIANVEWGVLRFSGEYFPEKATRDGRQMSQQDDYEVTVWRCGVQRTRKCGPPKTAYVTIY